MTDTDMNILFHSHRNSYTIWRWGVLILVLTLFMCNTAWAIDDEFKEYCLGEVFDAKYSEASCWSCDVVKILMSSMMKVTQSLYKEIKELCTLILQLGAAIWLALYFMKSLSSFAAQDPAKVLDGTLSFMFKWAIIYTLVAAGLDAIMEYIVNPLLSIGFDIGSAFASHSRISLL